MKALLFIVVSIVEKTVGYYETYCGPDADRSLIRRAVEASKAFLRNPSEESSKVVNDCYMQLLTAHQGSPAPYRQRSPVFSGPHISEAEVNRGIADAIVADRQELAQQAVEAARHALYAVLISSDPEPDETQIARSVNKAIPLALEIIVKSGVAEGDYFALLMEAQRIV